ncbi:MAG: hypothetical protein Tsb0027_10260 [Wenzhouxiangellaceae bacterium]
MKSPPDIDPYGFADFYLEYVLAEYKSCLKINGNEYDGESRIVLDLKNDPRIYIYGDFTCKNMTDAMKLHFGDGDCEIELTVNDLIIRGFRIGGGFTESGFDLKWCPKWYPFHLQEKDISNITTVRIHLFNYMNLKYFTSEKETSADVNKKYFFECNKFKVYFRPVSEIDVVVKEINEYRTCKLTHTVEIFTGSDYAFDFNEYKNIIELMDNFFTFIKGRRIYGVCPIGLTESGFIQSFSAPNRTDYGAYGCINPEYPDSIKNLFPKFYASWLSNVKMMRELIYLYIYSNETSSSDVSIIITCSALERLSYQILVVEKSLMGRVSFRNMPLSKKIRLLLEVMDIPRVEYDKLSFVNEFMSLNTIQDYPYLINLVRNSLVHTDINSPYENSDIYHHVSQLCLFYLELTMLAYIGFDGHYSNRLTDWGTGRVSVVPWRDDANSDDFT